MASSVGVRCGICRRPSRSGGEIVSPCVACGNSQLSRNHKSSSRSVSNSTESPVTAADQSGIPLLRNVRQQPTAATARQIVDLCEATSSPFYREWFVLVPARLDDSPALARAVSAVTSAIHCRMQPTLRPARHSEHYSRAIYLLNRSLRESEPVLLTIIALLHYEILVGGDVRTYRCHLQGLYALLMANSSRWATNEIGKTAFAATKNSAVISYIRMGKSLPFEPAVWSDVISSWYHQPDTKALSQHAWSIMSKLPWLMSNIRKFRSARCNRHAANRVIFVLHHILSIRDNRSLRTAMSRCATEETISEVDRSIVPVSLHFTDVRDYDALLEYFRARLKITTVFFDLAYFLFDDVPFEVHSRVREEQLEMLDYVLMCWEYCVQAQRFTKCMCNALFPIYGALCQMGSYHNRPLEDVLPWLETKSVIALGHWKDFRGLRDLALNWDIMRGGLTHVSLRDRSR